VAAVAAGFRAEADRDALLARIAERTGSELAELRERCARPATRAREGGDAGASAPTSGPADNPYRIVDGRHCRLVVHRDGVRTEPLSNFRARIVEDILRDDGVECTRQFVVEAEDAGGTPLGRVAIPADEFSRLDWVVPRLGPGAIVEPGRGAMDHLRAAIQFSSRPVRRRVYVHTGWREIDGHWYFLHAGGSIGPDASIAVELPDALRLFRLPDPPTGPERAAAIRATLALGAGLGPDRLTLPLLAVAVRAVVGDPKCSVHIQGRTNTFKTELAALIQRGYGREMGPRRLPASWVSTENALEATAAAAKDVVLVVDDFVPLGGGSEAAAFHRKGDRVFRGVGNGCGRGRCGRDGTPRAARPPRCLLLSTGEETPRGQSLQSRILRLDVAPGDIDRRRLKECQCDASSGLYATTTAAFAAWLAPRLPKTQERLRADTGRLRDELVATEPDRIFPRTIDIVADLLAGVAIFLDLAVEAGAIDEAERGRWHARFRRAFVAGLEEQAPEDPAERHLALLRAALATGLAHLLDCEGRMPAADIRRSCGWGPGRQGSDSPGGPHMGWTDRVVAYLEPDASFAVSQGMAESQGEPLPFRKETLHKRLRELGHLRATETSRHTLVVRKMIAGARRAVLALPAETLGIGVSPGQQASLTTADELTNDLTSPSPSPARTCG
jgi:hypothetical protein